MLDADPLDREIDRLTEAAGGAFSVTFVDTVVAAAMLQAARRGDELAAELIEGALLA
jgi:hypothetical protein